MQAAAVLPPTDDLRERVLGYLADRTVFNLATAGPAGLWTSAVLYVNDGLVLYFTSVAATRHGVNMHATGNVAGTISDECRQWTEMKGLQLEGTVELVDDDDERLRVVRAYLARFPFAAGLWHGESDPEVIARDPGIHGFYRITPTKLLFTDNEHTPGMREELAIG
jgi:uncharacterized protein YhbP (UPF0306 family)